MIPLIYCRKSNLHTSWLKTMYKNYDTEVIIVFMFWIHSYNKTMAAPFRSEVPKLFCPVDLNIVDLQIFSHCQKGEMDPGSPYSPLSEYMIKIYKII